MRSSNKADAQNPAMMSLFQIGRHRRRVCDLRRWAERPRFPQSRKRN
jgi:hypothetical protein